MIIEDRKRMLELAEELIRVVERGRETGLILDCDPSLDFIGGELRHSLLIDTRNTVLLSGLQTNTP